MSNRKIIQIDENRCNGCGHCATACAEGAIQVIDGKAKLFSEDHCDGLGACIGHCPQGALTLVEQKGQSVYSCPNSQAKRLTHLPIKNWPIQLTLIPENADYFDHAHLVIAADCTAFSSFGFHDKFLQEKVLLIGCPKLDNNSFYIEKLTRIFKRYVLHGVTVVRMSVPCCQKLTEMVKEALRLADKNDLFNERIVEL